MKKEYIHPKYNITERCISFSTGVLNITEKFPKTTAGSHIKSQVIRSASAAALHYGEAQAAESPKDFIHKMKLALKELRESYNALRMAKKMSWLPDDEFAWLLDENNQLISIFYTSIQTATNNLDENDDTPKKKKKKKKNKDDTEDDNEQS